MYINKKTIIGSVLAVFFVSASVALAAFADTEWEFYKELTFPQGVVDRTLVEVVLDRESLDHSYQSDLRIVSDAGEVPYVFRESRDMQTAETFSPRMQNLSRVPGIQTSFVLDFGQTTIHNEVTIDTTSKNFRKSILIEGSNDASSWRLLTDKAIIYDYSLEFSARNTQVSYPEATFRFLRVTMNDSDAPIDVTGARAHRTVVQQGVMHADTLMPAVLQVGKTTEVIIDMKSKGVLIDRAELAITGADFERSVAVYGSDDQVAWNFLGNDVIYSYKTARLEGKKTGVMWNGARNRFLKIVIMNNDNPPLLVTSATVYGPTQSLVFLADQGHSYRLFYGNDRTTMPSYDFSSISRYFVGESVVIASLSSEIKNPKYVAPIPPVSERMPYLVPVILGILTVVLGLIIFRLFKRTEGSVGLNN